MLCVHQFSVSSIIDGNFDNEVWSKWLRHQPANAKVAESLPGCYDQSCWTNNITLKSLAHCSWICYIFLHIYNYIYWTFWICLDNFFCLRAVHSSSVHCMEHSFCITSKHNVLNINDCFVDSESRSGNWRHSWKQRPPVMK